MSIQLDWEIVEEDTEQLEPIQSTPPAERTRPRWLRWLITLAVLGVVTGAGVASYAVWAYRAQVAKVAREIRPVAKLEAQAVAANDLTSFMVLQDPDDGEWRAFQRRRFGQLERAGWPELGWSATGTPPQPGSVTLEPGGARLDVTHQFSITRPQPNGPAVVKVNVPQYYKQMPSGWVRASPGVGYWGSWESRSGKFFAVRYTRRDAEAVLPLIPRMDAMLAKVCDTLRCPPQPIYMTFDNSPDALARLSGAVRGFDDGSFMLSLPSPQFLGIPAGQAAQDEFARMVGARIVQALVFETANRRLDLSNFPPRVLLQWELSKAGLDGPFITAEMTRTLAGILQAGTWPPLGNLSLRARSSAVVSVEDAALLSSAFAFLERQFGPGTVERLIPAMQSNATLGEAINTVWKINAASLEPARVAFWRRQVGLPAVQAPSPGGDLALLCAPTRNTTTILRGRADGTGYFSTLEGTSLSLPMWSPTGDKLAYLQGRQVAVLDVTTLQTKTLVLDYVVGAFNWLPDGRLLLNRSGASRNSNYVFDLATSALIQITGTGHVWSPDGARVASLGLLTREAFPSAPASQNNIAIWVADADGREDKPIALGFSPVWSPDSRQLAFVNALSFGPGNFAAAGEIRIADATGDAIRTLARITDLVESAQGASWLGNMAWSPDGALLAVTVNRSSGATIFVLEVETGRTRVTWRGAAARWMSLAWSPDSRYVGFWTVPSTSRDTTVGIVGALDAATGQAATIAGRDFDWSPDGQWLAIPQEPVGMLLVAPDLSAMRWLDLPNCSSVAWRPGKRD